MATTMACLSAHPRPVCRAVLGSGDRTAPRNARLRALAPRAAAPPTLHQSTQTGTDLTREIIADEKKYILQTYARPDFVLTHGEGARLYDLEGHEYLDFTSGIAVNALGHADPRWVASVSEQAGLLAHTSNLYHTVPQVVLAKSLVENSFADVVFYANSGTEANEAAIKFARKFAKVQAGVDPYDVEASASAPSGLLAFTGSFHGRTLGSLSLTYKSQYRTPFQPLTPGSDILPFGDLAAARAALATGRYAAVFVEPIQGEGGVHDPGATFLKGLRAACDEAGTLLVFDEVQVGLGRTGALWAHTASGVEPDMMTLAKPLAGGLPIGAVLLSSRVADVMAPGDHGSTFAGNPLVCQAAVTTFDIIRQPAFLAEVQRKGQVMVAALEATLADNPHVTEVRGKGLIVGVQLDQQAGAVVAAARAEGLLLITAGKGDVVRLVPPLVVTDEEIHRAVAIIAKVFGSALA